MTTMHTDGQKMIATPDLSVHVDYTDEGDLREGSAHAYIVELIGSAKKVLELGAGSGALTKHLASSGARDIVALEINLASVEKLRAYVDRVYVADLNEASWTDAIAQEGKFDAIVAADVLEHLYDPWTTIKRMKGLLNEGGFIITSLPHIGHAAIIACLIGEDFEYQQFGLLDKTHIRFFGLHNINALHADAALAIVDARFVTSEPEETEFASRWAALPGRVKAALSYHKHGHGYQIVTKATPLEQAGGRTLDLADAPIAERQDYFYFFDEHLKFRKIAELLCSVADLLRPIAKRIPRLSRFAEKLHRTAGRMFRQHEL
jgi:2-polyprenyl-3-methyl-5-hydroxy-6-metoxy-1,4-benzoquinol methylase